MKAFVFPGQGAQFSGMGKDLFDASEIAQERFRQADDILGFSISSTMFSGSDEDLKQTSVTQPAIFLHSVILAELMGERFAPDMAAGHSLGEFSALVAAGALQFEDGLKLVSERAQAMQDACNAAPSTMAAVLGMEDEQVEEICAKTPGVVVAANYNCPGQLVISGEVEAIHAACSALTEAGRGEHWFCLSVGHSIRHLWNRHGSDCLRLSHRLLLQALDARLYKTSQPCLWKIPRKFGPISLRNSPLR